MKLSFLILLAPLFSLGQRSLDTKIVVNTADTLNLFEQIRVMLVKNGYMVKDDRNPDTLTTYPRDRRPLGYVVIKVAVVKAAATFWGYYGRRSANAAGFTRMPSEYEKILYYPGNHGKGWKELMKFATALNGILSYEK